MHVLNDNQYIDMTLTICAQKSRENKRGRSWLCENGGQEIKKNAWKKPETGRTLNIK